MKCRRRFMVKISSGNFRRALDVDLESKIGRSMTHFQGWDFHFAVTLEWYYDEFVIRWSSRNRRWNCMKQQILIFYWPEIDVIPTSISSRNWIHQISRPALPPADGTSDQMHIGWKEQARNFQSRIDWKIMLWIASCLSSGWKNSDLFSNRFLRRFTYISTKNRPDFIV